MQDIGNAETITLINKRHNNKFWKNKFFISEIISMLAFMCVLLISSIFGIIEMETYSDLGGLAKLSFWCFYSIIVFFLSIFRIIMILTIFPVASEEKKFTKLKRFFNSAYLILAFIVYIYMLSNSFYGIKYMDINMSIFVVFVLVMLILWIITNMTFIRVTIKRNVIINSTYKYIAILLNSIIFVISIAFAIVYNLFLWNIVSMVFICSFIVLFSVCYSGGGTEK